MNKYLLPILFMSLLYWSCEPEPEDCTGEPGGNAICGCVDDNAVNYDSTATNDDGSCIYDTTEPSIQFTSPNPNDTLGGIITLRVEAQDDYEITKVEFKLHHLYEIRGGDEGETILEDDSLFTDTEEPYEYEWNSTEYEYVGASFSARAYDGQNDKDIHLSPVYIDNRPETVNVTSVQYVWNEGPEYIVQWEESTIEDFEEYKLLWYNVNESSIDTIVTITDRSVTSHNVDIVSGMPPTQANTFVILVKNELGFTMKGDEMENEVIGDPVVVLEPIVVNNDSTELTLTWSQSSALGTSTYRVWEATNSSFNNITRYWYPYNGGMDTTITVPLSTNFYGFDDVLFYKVDIFSPFGQEGTSNVEPVYFTQCNDDEISLWGDCYNTTYTTQIDRSGLAGQIPSSIGELVNLTELIINNGQLSGLIPPEIENLINLIKLDISHNHISGTIPPEIGNLANLTGLYLNSNHIIGSIPPEIGGCISLTELHLGDNDLNGTIPPEIGNCTDLKIIVLSHMEMTSSIPDEIGNLVNMEQLFFRDNNFTGSIPAGIGNMTQLDHLDLRDNQLSGSIPPELGNLTNLWKLNLSRNQLSGSIPSEMGNMSYLFEFALEENQLTGSIPSSIGNLDSVGIFHLEWNQLSGPIPAEIGDMENVYTIKLNDNQLTGSIPSEIGNLQNIGQLYLFANQLSGEVPESICNLDLDFSDGSEFRVEYNRLCPPYPSCIEDHVGHQEIGDCD